VDAVGAATVYASAAQLQGLRASKDKKCRPNFRGVADPDRVVGLESAGRGYREVGVFLQVAAQVHEPVVRFQGFATRHSRAEAVGHVASHLLGLAGYSCIDASGAQETLCADELRA